MKKGYYSVTLPVKTHIRKFINKVEGEQIVWNNQTPLCIVLRAFMSSPRSPLYSSDQYQAALSVRKDCLKIFVPLRKKSVVGTAIHPGGVVLINQLLEDCFENTLVTYVCKHSNAAGRYRGCKAAIESFAALYDIDLTEDISFSGMQKIYQRRQKRENKNTNLVLSLYTPYLAAVS